MAHNQVVRNDQDGGQDEGSVVGTDESTPAGTDRRWSWLAAILVFAAVLALFSPAIHYSFVSWDDDRNVFANPQLNPAVTLEGSGQFWTMPYYALYTPLTYTFWALCGIAARLPQAVPVLGDATPTTLDARAYHLLGIVCHAMAAVVVFLLLKSLTRRTAAAAVGALLWAVHPVQVESVAWVTGGNNVFSGLFSLLALWLFVQGARAREGDVRRALGAAHFTAATLALTAALLCKPTAAATPLVAAALAVLVLRLPIRRWASLLALWTALAATALVVTRITSAGGSDAAAAASPVWGRPIVALDALAFSTAKLVRPLPFAVDYGRTPAWVLRHPVAYVNAVAIMIAIAAALCLAVRRDNRWPAASLMLFALGQLPTLGLVPFYFNAVSTVADRYLYLAMIGPALGLSAAVGAAEARAASARASVSAVAPALLLVGLFAGQTALTLPVWHDSLTLFTQTVAVNPDSRIGHYNRANALASAGRYCDAEAEYRTVLRRYPQDSDAHTNLGVVLDAQGHSDSAAAEYRAALVISPHQSPANARLAYYLTTRGKGEEAIAHWRLALLDAPDEAATCVTRGRALIASGRRNEGIAQLHDALHLWPHLADLPGTAASPSR